MEDVQFNDNFTDAFFVILNFYLHIHFIRDRFLNNLVSYFNVV